MSYRAIQNFTLSILVIGLFPVGLQAQDVDVQTDSTKVDVDRGRVDVDLNRGRDRSENLRSMNAQIATWLIVDQQSIVQLAKFGLERTKTPEVRQLAEAIVQDHQALADQLGGFTPVDRAARGFRANQINADESVNQDGEKNASDRKRDVFGGRQQQSLDSLADRVEESVERIADRAERAVEKVSELVDRNPGGDREGRLRQGGSESVWVSVHREITAELSKRVAADLDKRSGYEFDASLVGLFVASHLQQEAAMQVLSQRATGDLQQAIQQATATIAEHRQHAEQVMDHIKR